MALIYRVENERGSGPYTAEIDWNMLTAHSSTTELSDAHPTPNNDVGLRQIDPIWYMRHDEFCGFESRQKLDTWFDGFRDSLAQRGFHVSIYDAPEYKHGEHQSVFVRDTATKIGHEAL